MMDPSISNLPQLTLGCCILYLHTDTDTCMHICRSDCSSSRPRSDLALGAVRSVYTLSICMPKLALDVSIHVYMQQMTLADHIFRCIIFHSRCCVRNKCRTKHPGTKHPMPFFDTPDKTSHAVFVTPDKTSHAIFAAPDKTSHVISATPEKTSHTLFKAYESA